MNTKISLPAILLCIAGMNLYSEAALAVETLYENYSSGALESSLTTTFGGDWHAQTFWVMENHNVDAVKLKMVRQSFGIGGSVVASIRSTETKSFDWGDLEVPMGPDLASGSIAAASVTTSASGAWYEIVLNATVQLTAGKEYAVVMHTTGDPIKWRAAKTYANGNLAAGFNSGTDWTQTDPEWDFLFQIWGDPEVAGGLATDAGLVDITLSAGQLESSTMESLDLADFPLEAQETLPTTNAFAYGFFGFEISEVGVGGTSTVTLTFPDDVGVGSQYWKFIGGDWVRIPLGSNDGDNVITITLVDGGLGDGDETADATIRDPGGLAAVLFADDFEGTIAE